MDIKGKIEQKRTAMGDNEMSAKESKASWKLNNMFVNTLITKVDVITKNTSGHQKDLGMSNHD